MAKQQNIIEIIITAVDKAAPGLRGAAQKVADFTAKFPVLGGLAAIAGAKIIGAMKGAVDSIKRAYDETVKLGGAMYDTSVRTGISSEELSRWKYAIEQVGGSMQSFEANLLRLNKSIYKAADDPKSKAAKAFDTLGVAVTDADGRLRKSTDVLTDISRSLQTAGEGSKKFGAAQEVAAKGVSALMNLFKEGPEQMKAYFDEMDRIGGTMSKEFVVSCDEAGDAMHTLDTAWQGLENDIAQDANPMVTWWRNAGTEMIVFFNGMRERVKEWKDWRNNLTGGDDIDPEPEYDEEQKRKEEKRKVDAEIAEKELGEAKTAAAKKAHHDMVENLRAYAARIGAKTTVRVFDAEKMVWIEKKLGEKKLRENISEAIESQRKHRAEFQRKLREAVSKDLTISATVEVRVVKPKRLQEPEDEPWWGDSKPGEELPYDAEGDALDDVRKKREKANEELSNEASLYRDARDAAIEFEQALVGGLQNSMADFFESMLEGKASLKDFADSLRKVMIRAIAEYIAKLIIVRLLQAATGIGGMSQGGATPRADGGRIPGMAAGGMLVRGAKAGATIRGGRPGMDSVLFAGMPGEEIVDRSTSLRLRRFLSSYEHGGAVNPTMLQSSTTRSNVSINFNVGRPVSAIDELTYGRTAVRAAKKVQEARL